MLTVGHLHGSLPQSFFGLAFHGLCLTSYVAVAAISLSSPARNARSTAAVKFWFIRSSC
jgi:hypothetical protein